MARVRVPTTGVPSSTWLTPRRTPRPRSMARSPSARPAARSAAVGRSSRVRSRSTTAPASTTPGQPAAGLPGTAGSQAEAPPPPMPKHSPLDGLHAILEYKDQGIDYDKDRNTRDNNNQISKELPDLKITLPRDLINDHAYFTD